MMIDLNIYEFLMTIILIILSGLVGIMFFVLSIAMGRWELKQKKIKYKDKTFDMKIKKKK